MKVEEYREQMQKASRENKELKNRLSYLIEGNKRKLMAVQSFTEQMGDMEEKRQKCIESQQKIEGKTECPSCESWNLHCDQMSSLCLQLQGLVERRDVGK
jgi:hypothetical protein